MRDKNRSKCLDETPAKRTRTNLVAESPLRSNICFFCDEIGHFTSADLKHVDRADASLLHKVGTFTFDKNIRECATHLGDTKILAKLSEGDMIACEACYHLKCLSKFTNGYRSDVNKNA